MKDFSRWGECMQSLFCLPPFYADALTRDAKFNFSPSSLRDVRRVNVLVYLQHTNFSPLMRFTGRDEKEADAARVSAGKQRKRHSGREHSLPFFN